MNRVLIIAEGQAAGMFDPLDQIRPPFVLRNGAWTVAHRWAKLLQPTSIVAAVRPWLKELVAEQTGWAVNEEVDDFAKDVWIIEGTASPVQYEAWQDAQLPERISWSQGPDGVTRLPEGDWRRLREAINQWVVDGGSGDCPARETAQNPQAPPLLGAAGLWDLVNHLPAQLEFDWHLWWDNEMVQSLDTIDRHADTVVIDEDNVAVAQGVRLGPCAVVDASAGPIILDAGVEIEPFTRLTGPAYIGRSTQLLGGKVTGPCAFGPGCKISGEIEASIVQGFSNKAHDGFFGHGFLGEWVNLGAMTTNSDLKNTYGTVRLLRAGETVDTGCIKVGSYLSDHTKAGIGTLLPTGACLGVGVNIVAGGLTAKSIPPFVWGGAGDYVEHRLERMLETAKIVVERRAELRRLVGLAERMSSAEIASLRTCFERSEASRRAFLGAAKDSDNGE